MTRSIRFWNLLSSSYAKQSIGNEDAYQRKIAQTQSVMRPDMKVLEIGCGTGSTAVIHAPHVAQYTGVDYAPKMIDIARGKIGDAPNLSFEVSTFADWGAANASYDMILGLSILHLMPDYRAALAKANRLLKPGGYLVTSTICLGDHTGIVKYILPVASSLRIAPVVVPFKLNELSRDIQNAGFEIVDKWQPAPKEAAYHLSQKPA